MNRSYSKIRHMQESNQRLERRLISERVIREDDGAIKSAAEKAAKTASSLIRNGGDEKATNCSQLDGKISDAVFGMTEKNKNLDIKKGGVGVTISGSDWEEKVINEDPYSYVKLYNGKYCTKRFEKRNWIEVTDSKQIEAVEKALNSEIDWMSIYRKHEKKN